MKRAIGAMAGACFSIWSCTPEHGDPVRVGRPDGPYRATLATEPAAPIAGATTELVYRIEDARSARPVADLQIVHERVLHTFVVSADLEEFAHTHHEDFAPLSTSDLASGTFHYPHVFRRSGLHRIVAEFTHRNRTWLKHFEVTVGGKAAASRPLEPRREQQAGGFRFSLAVSPDPPVAGKETEMICRIETADGRPVTDLAMVLGSEVHMATWRTDGEHFGHAHAWTEEMAAMMAAMAEHAGHAGMAMMAGSGKQTVFGPEVPLRHVFPAPGIYKVFLDLAPSGRRTIADFVVEVRS